MMRGPSRAMRAGHDIELLKGSEAFFPRLIEAIDGARREVLLETYIFDFSHSSIAVAVALEAAAKRGVMVRVIVDGFGTGEIPAEWKDRWKAAGLHWRIFNPAHGWRLLLPKRWRRMHRKLCAVDAALAFCGGINLLDDFYDPNFGTLDEPRFDFSVRVTGPLVEDVHETMTRLWARLQVGREAGRGDLPAAVEAVGQAVDAGTDMADEKMKEAVDLPRGGTEAPGGKPPALAALVLRDNIRFRRSIEGNYRLAIGLARSEILIANAYFVPGVQLQRALLRAARRGVRGTQQLQGRDVYGMLLGAGIEIIEYDESFLHAKVAVMDSENGALATVGSSNLDPLSLLLAREANVFVRDDAFAAELRGHLMAAIAKGRRVEKDEHTRWPLASRIRNWLAYLAMRALVYVSGKRY
jgi:cardiolipin synthase